ncbi:MAG: phenylalanine--tRNA ligase subunit beta, partial [Candidatus Roseilinea sp.]|uniref:phenylalanine--tRNA ligase subunit beta n=1 Tax=Candidatus Roseilinea sp. TaxID=2838777 RepID=UPI00404AE998
INNIVDVSNYVMLELGQPTHAFDFDAIAADDAGRKKIITRLAEPGERLTTLDGAERELLPSDIVVADPARALSIAGVMGGADSEVTDATRNLLFEAASWNWVSIRRTARHHNLHSEASYRFARGVHPALAMLAQKRGLHLLQQHAGGIIAQGILDGYPEPLPPVVIDLKPAEVTRTLGIEVPADDITRILRSLEFQVEVVAEERLRVTAPQHRLDIEGPHDLIEEVARIYGYDRVPATLMNDAIPAAHGTPEMSFEERVRDLLAGAGLYEIVSYRLTTRETEARMLQPGAPADDRPYVTLQNPINPERVVMRHTLTANVMEALASNLRHRDRVALFELGSIYLPSKNGILPDELPRLAIGMSGARAAKDLPWQVAPGMLDFFDLKGVVQSLLNGLYIYDARYQPAEHPSYWPGRTAALVVGDQHIGTLGEIHPRVREAWGLAAAGPVLLADIDLAALRVVAEGRTMTVTDVPRFPAIHEDLAVIVEESLPAENVERAIRAAGGNLLSDTRLFDVFRGEQIGAGKKSLAYALTYRAADRTLTNKEAEKVRNKIIRSLEGQLGGLVRR